MSTCSCLRGCWRGVAQTPTPKSTRLSTQKTRPSITPLIPAAIATTTRGDDTTHTARASGIQAGGSRARVRAIQAVDVMNAEAGAREREREITEWKRGSRLRPLALRQLPLRIWEHQEFLYFAESQDRYGVKINLPFHWERDAGWMQAKNW